MPAPAPAPRSCRAHESAPRALGLHFVLNDDGDISIFTDGDLRRLIEQGVDLRIRPWFRRHADLNPQWLRRPWRVMPYRAQEAHRISSVLVVDAQGRLRGALNTWPI